MVCIMQFRVDEPPAQNEKLKLRIMKDNGYNGFQNLCIYLGTYMNEPLFTLDHRIIIL